MKPTLQHKCRCTSFILLALIVFQGLGWFLVWQAIEWRAKVDVQNILFQEDTPVREVVLSLQSFQKSMVGIDELKLDGSLYDIRSGEFMADSVRLVLFHDCDEEDLYSMLGIQCSLLDGPNSTESHPLSMWVAQWLGAAFILPPALTISIVTTNPESTAFRWDFPSSSAAQSPLFIPPRIVFEIAQAV